MQKLVFVIRFSFLEKDRFDKSNPYFTPTLILPLNGEEMWDEIASVVSLPRNDILR